MASNAYVFSAHNLLHELANTPLSSSTNNPEIFKTLHFHNIPKLGSSPFNLNLKRNKHFHPLFAATAQVTPAISTDPSSEFSRRLYIGNIPRDVNNIELSELVGKHGVVEMAEVMYDKYTKKSRRFAFVTMKTIEDANAAIEKLNETEIRGRKIKVNVTEKPLVPVDLSGVQAEESQFVETPYKVYIGNLAKTVTKEILEKFFATKGLDNVLGLKISRVPGTTKSSGFGFITFSSKEEAEAAIESLHNAYVERQRIRVNKA